MYVWIVGYGRYINMRCNYNQNTYLQCKIKYKYANFVLKMLNLSKNVITFNEGKQNGRLSFFINKLEQERTAGRAKAARGEFRIIFH